VLRNLLLYPRELLLQSIGYVDDPVLFVDDKSDTASPCCVSCPTTTSSGFRRGGRPCPPSANPSRALP